MYGNDVRCTDSGGADRKWHFIFALLDERDEGSTMTVSVTMLKLNILFVCIDILKMSGYRYGEIVTSSSNNCIQ